MKRLILMVMTVSLLAGSWQAAVAQSAKPAKPPKATQPKPAEAAPVETAAVPAALADTTPVVDSTASDTAHHKKKHGLLGKAKGVMSNKIVKTVAKAAACTMVPGGQVIAGAIDAASSKSVGEAAGGAAGAATGTSCMPGMGGAGMGGAGMAGAGMAGAGMGAGAGLAGLAASGVAGAAVGQMTPGTAGYAPGTGVPGMEAYGMGDPKPMADCVGLTVEEYTAMSNPTGGQPRAMTKAETKRSQQLTKKVGSRRMMECNQQVGMQQANAQMVQMQQMMGQANAQSQGRMPAANGLAAPVVPGGPQPGLGGETPAPNGDASATEQFGPVAACLGITVEEYVDMTYPTRGEMRPPTKDESKRAEKLTKKVGQKRVSKCESERVQAPQ